MSYTSENKIPKTTNIAHVREVIELLGYHKVKDGLRIPDRVGSYYWYDRKDYKSWSGVELDLYKKQDKILVSTHSTVSRSYWDLLHQNKTIKFLRDLFGGCFYTDAGKNRYWRPDGAPPSPTASGCFLAIWHFKNALMKVNIYLDCRKLDAPIARENPSGLRFIDELNPRLLSNNLILPYVVAVWEDYFRMLFEVLFTCSNNKEKVLKEVRLTYIQMEQILAKNQSIERAITDSLYFQRPSIIVKNFKLIDNKLDVGTALKKPYKNRKKKLLEVIEEHVLYRHRFVHSGEMNTALFDKQIKILLEDFSVAARRIYEYLGEYYGFHPRDDY